jgi:hypothetical protein
MTKAPGSGAFFCGYSGLALWGDFMTAGIFGRSLATGQYGVIIKSNYSHTNVGNTQIRSSLNIQVIVSGKSHVFENVKILHPGNLSLVVTGLQPGTQSP